MRAYQIENWLDGTKIRQIHWLKGYVYYRKSSGLWADENNNLIHAGIIENMFTCDDWEVYEEPKKKKTVTMYRVIYTVGDGSFSLSQWHSCKKWFDTFDIVGWEQREIEVDG